MNPELDDYYTKQESDARFATIDRLSEKQDIIDDLADIRRGAEKGANALQTHQAAIRYDNAAQGLTEEQKANARGNVGLSETTNAEIDTILNS